MTKIWTLVVLMISYPLSSSAIEPNNSLVEDVNNGAMVKTLEIAAKARFYNAEKYDLSFGGSPHAQGHESASFVIHGNYIYAPYYHEDFTVRLVRLNVKTKESSEITFENSLVPCYGNPRRQDSHFNFAFDISDDGVMHLFFGHHRHRLRYLKSVAGAADVDDANFTEALFLGPPAEKTANMVQFYQDRKCNVEDTKEWPFLNESDGIVWNLTYPRLTKTDDGMTLFFRLGIPTNSEIFAAHYDGNGNWSKRFRVIDGKQGTQVVKNGVISSNRGPYIHTYRGKASHMSWTYRESDSRHKGVHYATSQDHMHWRNLAGIQTDKTFDVDSTFTTVDPDLSSVFLFVRNTEDRHGAPHITAYVYVGPVYGVNVWQLYHYTPIDGTWQKTKIGNYTSMQPTLLADPDSDDLYLVANDYHNGVLRIQRAGKDDNWQNWTTVFEGAPGYVSGGYSKISHNRIILAMQQDIMSADADSSPYELMFIKLSELKDPID